MPSSSPDSTWSASALTCATSTSWWSETREAIVDVVPKRRCNVTDAATAVSVASK
jgi:hypothetical protein